MERRLFAAVWTLRLIAEHVRDLLGKLAAIWEWDAMSGWPWEEGWWRQEAEENPAMAIATTPKILVSPRRTYALETKIAAGDLCDVYLAESNGEHFVVKAPRITGPAADKLMEREMRILQRLVSEGGDHYRLYFPQPVETFADAAKGRRYNVLQWTEGLFTAGEIITRHPSGVEGRHLAWMFKRMLAALGYVHRLGWVHGAVLPPHLLFHAESHGLQLASWIHAVRPGEPLTLAPAEFQSWYPPECRQGAQTATDLYLAAKSLIYLAGGDPVENTLPDDVPRPMQQFLKACLLESPAMRPSDAWELHEEFDELLADLYGPPQFVQLPM